LFDFRDRAEGIARALDEEAGRIQIEEVLGAELVGLAWWVQWIREQKQARSQF